jgi:EAL domain-containing protein (putative c-di-GMP-specific phosphodiesterase class I)
MGMKTRLRQEALLDSQLRVALEREEFVLWYQPQVELRTGRIVGAEALLRWRQPDGQLASPGVFLARAEETGLIVRISEWVAMEACRAAKRWPRQQDRGIPVSINLSPLQFGNGTAPLTIARALGESGLDPRLLEVEITETALIDQFETVAADLKKLRDIGVRASIDDFGVGYSSINYVKRLPVTRLKIDQTFIRDLPGHSKDLAILRAILTLGRSFGLEVLGEGVETQAQAERLTEEGCELAQGYFFARPMPEADFVALLARDRAFPLSA